MDSRLLVESELPVGGGTAQKQASSPVTSLPLLDRFSADMSSEGCYKTARLERSHTAPEGCWTARGNFGETEGLNQQRLSSGELYPQQTGGIRRTGGSLAKSAYAQSNAFGSERSLRGSFNALDFNATRVITFSPKRTRPSTFASSYWASSLTDDGKHFLPEATDEHAYLSADNDSVFLQSPMSESPQARTEETQPDSPHTPRMSDIVTADAFGSRPITPCAPRKVHKARFRDVSPVPFNLDRELSSLCNATEMCSIIQI
jgi:hypothetical protein